MRIPFIAGNWKMFKTQKEARDFAELLLTAGGDVAQLVERCFRKAEAGGSNPLISTRHPLT